MDNRAWMRRWEQGLEQALALLALPPDMELMGEWGQLRSTSPLVLDGSPSETDPGGQRQLRLVVFGPFNYGKSTLLNAILGEKALPIDLIPTTGAAIEVCYGEVLTTRIVLQDGAVLEEAGTGLLQTYSRLDDAGAMRADVREVTVFCPHPWLQTGVVLVDLPGTDDRVAQDQLVKEQLLTADGVLQLLDGRKLMTLGEREHLRDWLSDRGLETVIFVVNFLNLLEPEDQRQVMTRMCFVAESFRSRLPDGLSNLYRVDALPALRARLKGDAAAAQMSGLPDLEAALQRLVDWLRDPAILEQARLRRLERMGQQVQPLLTTRAALLSQALAMEGADPQAQRQGDDRLAQRRALQAKALGLIGQGFGKAVEQARQALAIVALVSVTRGRRWRLWGDRGWSRWRLSNGSDRCCGRIGSSRRPMW